MPADYFSPRRRLITPFGILFAFVGLSLLGLVVFVIFIAHFAPANPARDGQRFYDEHRYYSAIQQFDRALQLDPDDPTTLYYRGLSYLATNQYSRAVDDLEAVLRLDPTKERIEERLGRAYLESGDHPRARDIFERLAGEEPDNARVLHLLAQTYYESYQDHLQEIGVLVLRYVGGELAAALLRDLELLVFSRQVHDDLNALLEQNERAFDSLGERELRRLVDRAHQAIEKSVPHFRAALAVPDFDPEAALSLAQIYRRQGRLGWTRDECEDAIRRCTDPIDSLPFRFLLAAVYFEMGVYQRCADVYLETFQLAEDLTDRVSDEEQTEVDDAWRESIDRVLPVLLKLEDYDTVRELAAGRADPQNEPILYYYLGTSALATGEVEAARQYLRRAKGAFENKPALRTRYRDAFLDTYLDLAGLAIEESQFGQAESHLASLLQRDPTSTQGHLALVDLRRRQGNERGARQLLEQAMLQNPADQELADRWWELWTQYFEAQGLAPDAGRATVWSYFSASPRTRYLQMRAAQAILDEYRGDDDARLALSLIESIAIQNPELVPINTLQARIFLARGDYELARELFESVLEKRPEDATAILGLRDCASRLRDIDERHKWAHEALKVGADEGGPLVILERLVEGGEYNRALAYSEQLLSMMPDRDERAIDIEMLRLRALLEEGAIDVVQKELGELVEKEVQHPALLPLLIRTHLRSGRYPQALESIRRHAERLDVAFYHDALSDILAAESELGPATSAIVQKAMQDHPTDERIASLASRYFRRVQSYADAVVILRRATAGSGIPSTPQLLDLTLLSIPGDYRLTTGTPEWTSLENRLAEQAGTQPLLSLLLELAGDSARALEALPEPDNAGLQRLLRQGWPGTIFAVHLRQGSYQKAAAALGDYGPHFEEGYRSILEYCLGNGLHRIEVTEAVLELALFAQVPRWESEALESLELLLSVFPSNPALRRLHPVLRARTGSTPAEVLALYEQLAEDNPTADSFRALANAQLELGLHGEAIRSLLTIRKLGHPTPDDLLAMARALAGAGEPMAAARVFDVLFRFDQRASEAVERKKDAQEPHQISLSQARLTPDWQRIPPETLLSYGELFADGLPENPVQDALERWLPPKYPGRRVLAGALQPPSWELLPSTILKILERHRNLSPRQARRLFDLLQTRSKPGDKAIPLVSKLAKSDVGSVPITMFLLDAHLASRTPPVGEALSEQLALAEKVLDRDRSRLPLELRSHYLGRIAELHLDHGNPEHARDLLRRALVLTPDRSRLYLLMGECSAALGHHRDAELEFRVATRLFPWDAEAWAQLAWFYGEQGLELGEASRLVEERLEVQPDEPALLTGLAWIRYQQGRADAAAQLADSARVRDPSSSRAAFVLGLASYALGRLQEALEPLRFAAGEKTDLRGDDLEYARILLYRAARRLGESPEEARSTVPRTVVSAGPR